MGCGDTRSACARVRLAHLAWQGRRWRRILAITLLFALGLTSLAAPASAQPRVDGAGGNDAGEPRTRPDSFGGCRGWDCAGGLHVGDRAGGAGSGGPNAFTYSVGTPAELAPELRPFGAADPVVEAAQAEAERIEDGSDPVAAPADAEVPPAPADPQRWVVVYCPWHTGGPATQIVDVFLVGDPPTPATVARLAREVVRIPLPHPTFSPGAEHFQVVGLETWIWLTAEETAPRSGTACLPPSDYACVTVTATFRTLSADMADGSGLTHCDGAGTPYDPSVEPEAQFDVEHCGHVYIETPGSGRTYPAQVGATWHASFSCAYDADGDGARESACAGGSLGDVTRLSDPVDLEVRDLQARAALPR